MSGRDRGRRYRRRYIGGDEEWSIQKETYRGQQRDIGGDTQERREDRCRRPYLEKI
jgi:hypothetical protein